MVYIISTGQYAHTQDEAARMATLPTREGDQGLHPACCDTFMHHVEGIGNCRVMTHPMRTVYWSSRRRPKTGTKKKRQARRRGPGWAAMPTAITPMYTRDRMLVARKAATSSENMVISNPQFCNEAQQASSQNLSSTFKLGSSQI